MSGADLGETLRDIAEMADPCHQADIRSAADEIERLRHSLADLLDYTDRHRVTWAEHDHDCFELWCIERDYARTLLPHNSTTGGDDV